MTVSRQLGSLRPAAPRRSARRLGQVATWAVLAAASCLALGCEPTDAGATSACAEVIAPGDAGRLEARLKRLPGGPCTWSGAETRGHEVVASWVGGEGEPLEVTLAPARCTPASAGDARRAGALSVVGVSALAASCAELGASVVPAVERLGVEPAAPAADGGVADVAPPVVREAPGIEALWVQRVVPGTWLLFFVLLLGWAGRTVRARGVGLPRSYLASASVAAAVAVGAWLRLGWAHPGPGDIINTVEEAYLGAAALEGVGLYGRGMEGLLVLLFQWVPASDDTVIALSIVLGLTTLVAVAWFARRLGYPARVGAFAAWLLAVAPLHVRFSATVNRYVPLVLLVVVGWAWLLGWLRGRGRLELALATLSLSLAAQCRPDAVPLVPVLSAALVVAWWGPRRRTWRPGPELWVALGVAGLVAGLPMWRVVADIVAEPYGNTGPLMGARPLFDPAHNAYLAFAYAPALWGLVALLGLRRPPGGDRWLLAWLVLAALVPTWLASVWEVDPNLNTARYHLLPLPFYVVLTAAGWGASRGRVAVAAGVALVLLAAVPLQATLAPRMMNDEYDFLRTHLPAVPDGCAVFTPAPIAREDLGLRPGVGVSRSAGRDHHWGWDLDGALEANPTCVVYYESGSCNMRTWRRSERLRATCDRLRADAVGVIATQRVRDLTSEGRAVVRSGTTVGLYWMVRPGG